MSPQTSGLDNMPLQETSMKKIESFVCEIFFRKVG
jgi:hypothetical protein